MKGSFVIVLVLVFSFVFVGAGSCDDGQTIMRVGFNFHVSFWNESVEDYTNEVCYDEIFGSAYTGDSSHECSGSNRVLSLVSVKNSHVSSVTDVNYNHEVCFGDLACEYDNSAGGECANGGEVVVRMQSDYNSHVSDASDVNYGVKVCCKKESGGIPSPASDVYWADMSGDRITEADFGDSVQMIVKGVSSGTFEILEKDILNNDEIKSIVGTSNNGSLVGVWAIGSDDLSKTGDYDKFYFKVGEEESDFLSINLEEDNAPMNITILSPDCGSYFDEGENITIEISAFDEDDLISGIISINDENVKSFGNGGVVFDWVFDSAGNFQIVVDGADDKGKNLKVISNIMILDKDASGNYVDGEYVAACISEPKYFSNIESSVVNFDASDTRAVSIVGGVFDLLVPGEDFFSWYWELSPAEVVRNVVNTKELVAYKFVTQFPSSGDGSAKLRVEVGEGH